MSRIIRLPAATRDMFAVWGYIASDDPDAADRLLDRIDAKVATLAASPAIGTPRPELGPRIRSVAVGHYVLFYRPVDHGIELVRVLHGARDIHRGVRLTLPAAQHLR